MTQLLETEMMYVAHESLHLLLFCYFGLLLYFLCTTWTHKKTKLLDLVSLHNKICLNMRSYFCELNHDWWEHRSVISVPNITHKLC